MIQMCCILKNNEIWCIFIKKNTFYSDYYQLTSISQLPAAMKWSRSINDDMRKHKSMLPRLSSTCFLDRTSTSVQVMPPTVAWVKLSERARTISLLPFCNPLSPINDTNPIKPVSKARNIRPCFNIDMASKRKTK